MDTMSNLLTTAQVAARVGKTSSTVNRWATTGKLVPAFSVPGQRGANLFDPADVVALSADAEVGS